MLLVHHALCCGLIRSLQRAEQVYESILASNPSALVYIRYMMFARRIHVRLESRRPSPCMHTHEVLFVSLC